MLEFKVIQELEPNNEIRVLNELTRYMYDIESEIIVCNSTKTKDIKDIDKAIEKLKQQEKKLVDLYLSSTLNVETINHKNDLIKKEIENLNKKKQQIDPYDELKDYTVELLKKLDCDVENGQVISNNKLAFSFVFNSLNRQSKKDLIKRLIDKIEIKRAKNYDVEIINDKVKHLIDMIKDMDIENKLRLAICMSDSSTTHLEYDKKEIYKHFDLLLKEINIEYRTTLVNFANYPLIIFAMAKIMEMDSTEQNKVALYLFNSINYKIKKYVNVDEILDNHKQMF